MGDDRTPSLETVTSEPADVSALLVPLTADDVAELIRQGAEATAELLAGPGPEAVLAELLAPLPDDPGGRVG